MAKIVALSLSALVLLSTLSWSVEKHLCMGRVMDIAFFHQAEACGMEEGMAIMGEDALDSHCCDDESFAVEGQDDLSFSWDEPGIYAQQFLVAFTYSFLLAPSIPTEDAMIQTTDPPPLLVRDLNLLHEVYLI